MKRINFTLAFVFALLAGATVAQVPTNDTRQQSIFQTLSRPDSLTGATVILHQDKRIELAMQTRRNTTQSTTTTPGFRVQVFSSNAQRTAKTEAFRIEKQIQEAFPDEVVYTNYASPFWKVRVGDFRTQADAQSLRERIIEAFPHLRSETYIVREQVFTPVSK